MLFEFDTKSLVFQMSRTYMVPSSMVSNNSMINAWLFVLLIPLEDYVRVLVVSVGVLFNIYVSTSSLFILLFGCCFILLR